jgi:hypothetical protein
MGISHQWKNGLRQDTVDERIGFGAAPLEFSARVAGRIDLAAQLRFQRHQQFQYLGERQVLPISITSMSLRVVSVCLATATQSSL